MPHGAPDWSRFRVTSPTYPIHDLAELAARTTSISRYDRRGDVIWWDTFEFGLQSWLIDAQGTGAAATTSPEAALSSGYSAKLVAGSDGGKYTAIHHQTPITSLRPLGLEIALELDKTSHYVQVAVNIYDAGQQQTYSFSYYPATTTLVLHAAEGDITLATDLALADSTSGCFHFVKLVIDPTGQTYKRLQINIHSYDLSAYAPIVAAKVADPVETISIHNQATPGTNPVLYVDNVILTQDEP